MIPSLSLHNHYTIGRQIGKGAQGSVFLATHKTSHEKLVVKVVSKINICPTKLIDLRHEHRVLQKLNHDHIIHSPFISEDDKEIRMYLEYASKGDLLTLLKRKRDETKCGFSEKETRHIVADLVSALSHAHSRRIVHGDIKLENVFLSENNRVKLGDWGLSTIIGEESGSTPPVSPRVSQGSNNLKVPSTSSSATSPRQNTPAARQVGCAGGSFQYSAPEVFTDAISNNWTDLWSLGVLMYVMLCGRFPFDFSRPYPVRYQKINPFPPHISPAARGLISRLLSVDWRLRPSIVEVAESKWLNMTEEDIVHVHNNPCLSVPDVVSVLPIINARATRLGLKPIVEEPEM
eukprot:TRINITY_DN10007_c0_g1_i1.p1 TRINITY_DN10007_c0_g1~~TRINITY_DN10007_c0_g1_i1.p1  ORF type:complete len:347 (-),score=57.47 TRINITY_DN10007_c0_g1_i1:129-1169(-)